eukprot:CAMPEP_0118898454 /NCGR_PEP_ID=MMETSP1166-20130328/5442_1 /TAXON_ID=1104430 /ORGANISM="Chrysoreinhardia sp, Strain CCMP3193" /LENGTH=490 /DNA_ID=CAMNT_0006837563 /DNA_START=59 /DNA_END=1531 /DNA_ORIENTATION=+
MATKLWGGAFGANEGPDPVMEKFNASIGFDKALCLADIAGSEAYARALGRCGVLSEAEVTAMVAGLGEVKREWVTGTFEIVEASDEDIHTANERRLGELKGKDLAGRLHTGRSRNDQVATDLRLWLRREMYEITRHLRRLIQVARDVAARDESLDAAMPGYTHLQRAQPIRWSHFVLSHAWAWTRDAERLQAAFLRSDKCPLGSGALAGHPFFSSEDRERLAKDLGFEGGPTENSLDSVADRDFCVDFAQFAALLGAHLARWSEDLIIYGSAEFGFVKFGAQYSTGSSLMPQKRNPDALELLRGKSARLQAASAQLLALVSKLPSAYNKDLQEDKEAVFDVAKTLNLALPVAAGVLRTLAIDPEKMRSALVPAMLATDLAEYLVKKGVPFRETHHVAGRAVRLAEDQGKTIADLSLDDLQTLHPKFQADVKAVFDFDASLEARDADGGTSLRAQRAQLHKLDDWLNNAATFGPSPQSASIVYPVDDDDDA